MNIPSSIDEALRDEVCVETALSLLKEARDEQAASVEAMRTARAPFDLLASLSRKKPEITGSIQEEEERLGKTNEAIAHTEKIHARLGAEIRELLEASLRKTDDGYGRSLDSASLAIEWLHALDRYEALLRSYVADLGQARNTPGAANHHHKKKKPGGAAHAALNKAVESAAALDREALVLNRLADRHRECVHNTPVAATELPAIPPNTHCERTRKLLRMQTGPLHAECDRIIHACEAFAGSDIARMREIVNNGIDRKKDLCDQHVLQQLCLMRQQARLQNIDFEKLEERISAIESRFPPT